MINKVSKYCLLGLALFLLTSCSVLKKPHGSSATKTAAAGRTSSAKAGVYTAGVGRAASFQGRNVRGANYKLRAGSNQTYHFDFDQSTVYPSDLASVKVQANYLVAHPTAKVRLEGNTDDRGSREYNIALGYRRAKAVARILKEQGVSPSQLSLISYGEERPVAFARTESAYRLNRRVDLVYEAK